MHDSILGGMYGVISILGRHERAPDREFQVFFAPVGEFQGIDGRAFVGNTPVFHSRVGDLVQWDVLALGSDHHTFHVHGHRWRGAGRVTDTRTCRSSDRPTASGSAGARTHRARGSTTATSRITWNAG